MTKAFTPSNLPLEERTVGRILARQADRLADKNFIETTSGNCISYRDMHLDQINLHRVRQHLELKAKNRFW
ncbi:MAG: hypothetical protein CM1200mP18_05700 [Gammaproteobacteria bacterium]|nr:MAG: hypothetical protein CM1200mP18_05700 [Gammaproteobacteria bacterium]